jgi:hypothetical protein
VNPDFPPFIGGFVQIGRQTLVVMVFVIVTALISQEMRHNKKCPISENAQNAFYTY